jgi:hypothetical protein
MTIDRSINCANCDKNTDTGYYITGSHGAIVCEECGALPNLQPRILCSWSAAQEEADLEAMDNENEARREYIANGGSAWDF